MAPSHPLPFCSDLWNAVQTLELLGNTDLGEGHEAAQARKTEAPTHHAFYVPVLQRA